MSNYKFETIQVHAGQEKPCSYMLARSSQIQLLMPVRYLSIRLPHMYSEIPLMQQTDSACGMLVTSMAV